MALAFDQIKITWLVATHHGPGVTCITLPYLLTRVGEEKYSAPVFFYNTVSAAANCFYRDGQTRVYGLYFLDDRMHEEGYVHPQGELQMHCMGVKTCDYPHAGTCITSDWYDC